MTLMKPKHMIRWSGKENAAVQAEVQSRLNKGKQLTLDLVEKACNACFSVASGRRRVFPNVHSLPSWTEGMKAMTSFPQPTEPVKVAKIGSPVIEVPAELSKMVVEAMTMVLRDMVPAVIEANLDIIKGIVQEELAVKFSGKPVGLLSAPPATHPRISFRMDPNKIGAPTLETITIVGLVGEDPSKLHNKFGTQLVKTYKTTHMLAHNVNKAAIVLMAEETPESIQEIIRLNYKGTPILFKGGYAGAEAAVQALLS